MTGRVGLVILKAVKDLIFTD